MVRRYIYIGAVVAAALAATLPAAAASAASVHVLTTGKAGGLAVKPGAVLKASLAPRTSVVFKNSLGTLTCTRSTITAKVVTNPVKTGRPAIARASITAYTYAGCKISINGIPGVTVKDLTAANLPYNVTVSDARGNPVRVSERSKAKPLLLSATVTFMGSSITCSVKAASITGTASNKGNRITIVTRNFTKASGPSFCPSSGTISATYGPLRDTSVKGSPAVFVN
jgi:hypothetical protein